MLNIPTQLELFQRPELQDSIRDHLRRLEATIQQPSAHELLTQIEQSIGLDARWDLVAAISAHSKDEEVSPSFRDYLSSLLADDALPQALRGEGTPDKEAISSIDALLLQSRRYRDSESFREMIEFIARFRDYSPYNNMLVKVQDPSCNFFATAGDWRIRFGRSLKEDAKPMLILAPMHPVLLVFDIDQTDGDSLPEELETFARCNGDWDPNYKTRLVKNAEGYRIRVDEKQLSSTHAGFARIARGAGSWKMRIAIHRGLDDPSRFGALCHELAHVLLGHLGSDYDHWWPARTWLRRSAIEVEAEAVAWLVTNRLGLEGSSATYISRHLRGGKTPVGVSLDMIAKTASLIERMSTSKLRAKKPRKRKVPSRTTGQRQLELPG